MVQYIPTLDPSDDGRRRTFARWTSSVHKGRRRRRGVAKESPRPFFSKAGFILCCAAALSDNDLFLTHNTYIHQHTHTAGWAAAGRPFGRPLLVGHRPPPPGLQSFEPSRTWHWNRKQKTVDRSSILLIILQFSSCSRQILIASVWVSCVLSCCPRAKSCWNIVRPWPSSTRLLTSTSAAWSSPSTTSKTTTSSTLPSPPFVSSIIPAVKKIINKIQHYLLNEK